MSIIELNDVSKTFRGNPVLRNVSATFEQGRIYGIVGPNGSGKSVLFKLICGFLRPDTGTISISPEYLNPKRSFPESFGVIIDRPGYLDHSTGLENLQELAAIRHTIGDTEIRSAMKEVGLDPDLKQKVRNYSLGMKQKLSLAQAIMEDPSVLLLDEPFNALDHDSTTRARDIVLSLKARGKTVLFTSHNAEDISLLSDEVLRIESNTLLPQAA